jgi:hypothetical protein
VSVLVTLVVNRVSLIWRIRSESISFSQKDDQLIRQGDFRPVDTVIKAKGGIYEFQKRIYLVDRSTFGNCGMLASSHNDPC